MLQDGKSYRLIPSLNGGLFRFDGEGVEVRRFFSHYIQLNIYCSTRDKLQASCYPVSLAFRRITVLSLNSLCMKFLFGSLLSC